MGVIALVAAALVLPAAGAGATAVDPGTGPQPGWRAGRKIVFPTHEAWHRAGHADPGEPGNPLPRRAAQPSGSGALVYGGGVDGIGVTTGAPKLYLVFWGSQWLSGGDPQGMAARLQALFQGVGTNNETWSGVMTQYCEGVAVGATACPVGAAHVGYPTGGALAGVWTDTSTAAPANATDHQIGAEAVDGGRALRQHDCGVEPERAVHGRVADGDAPRWVRTLGQLLRVARLER